MQDWCLHFQLIHGKNHKKSFLRKRMNEAWVAGARRALVNHTSHPISLIISQRVFSSLFCWMDLKTSFLLPAYYFCMVKNWMPLWEWRRTERKRVCKQTSEKELGQHLLRVRVAVVGHIRGAISQEQEMKSWNNFPTSSMWGHLAMIHYWHFNPNIAIKCWKLTPKSQVCNPLVRASLSSTPCTAYREGGCVQIIRAWNELIFSVHSYTHPGLWLSGCNACRGGAFLANCGLKSTSGHGRKLSPVWLPNKALLKGRRIQSNVLSLK